MVGLFFVESIIECEHVVLYVFGNSIHSVLGLMDLDLGVRTADGVDLTILLFFFEYRSFPYADG